MEQDHWGHFIREAERSGERLMEMLGDKMEQKARRYAPIRTGKLRASIRVVMLNNGREVRLFSDSPYAEVMESGSRPHLIHGVKANFPWKGGYFVWDDPKFKVGKGRGYRNWTEEHGATVRHPGTRPHRFFARAFTETWGEARLVMRRAYGG